MSEIKVNLIKGVAASAAAITVNNTDGTCTANLSNRQNRNLIINGAMNVAQRGTSFADPANSAYNLDRFSQQNNSGTPAFTFSQDSDAPIGFNNSLKVACTTADASPAAGSYSRIRYSVEAQDLQPLAKGTASAKASTLSFYVKTNKTGVYTVFVYDDDNNRMFSASYTVSDTNWNRYTISIPADTTGAIADDNGAGFHIHWGLSLGSNRTSGSLASTWAAYSTANEHVGNVNFADNTSNVWAITGVQLEVGSVATDFEHRSFADELRRCQRYFEICYGGYYGHIPSGAAGGAIDATVDFKVTKRANATLTKISDEENTTSSVSVVGANLSSQKESAHVRAVSIDSSGNDKYFFARFSASAEL